jgi:hypothetical protein
MKRHAVMAGLSLLLLPYCGGDGGPTGPTSSPTPPAAATIAVTQHGTAEVCLSPVKKYRFAIPLTIAESSGVGFFANFVNMSLFQANGALRESQDIGASDIAGANGGSNHLGARSSTNVVVHFDFNADPDKWDYARLTLDFTDDRGNRTEKVVERIDPVVVTFFCTI